MHSVLLKLLFDNLNKFIGLMNYLMLYINNISWANLYFNVLYVISDYFYNFHFHKFTYLKHLTASKIARLEYEK